MSTQHQLVPRIAASHPWQIAPRLLQLAALALGLSLPLGAQAVGRSEPERPKPQQDTRPQRRPHPCPTPDPAMTLAEAEAVAEGTTGGWAYSSRRIDLNGATGGFEVLIHMPDREKGWRVIIDRDTRNVRDKYPIPNPPKPDRRR